VGGALPEAEMIEVVELVGLMDGQITERFDCYAGTSSKSRLSADVDVHGANLFARKPA
jgi:arsenite methyltransferase